MKQSWAVYGLIGLGLILNLILFVKLQTVDKERLFLKSELRNNRKESQELERISLEVRKAENKHLAAVFQWDNLETLQGEEAELWFQNPQIKLLLVFSELSCDVCQDRVTQAANLLTASSEGVEPAVVVHAGNRRFAEAYIRTNGISFPVYFSKDDFFVRTNRIQCVPAAFLIGENGMVVGSHCPLPSQEAATRLFFRRCETVFKRQP